MGRPEKVLDWKKVENLLESDCNGVEVAAHFDMHPETFYRKVEEEFKIGFTEYSARKKAIGDSNIKAKQYNKAISGKGDNSMLTFLGRVRLLQRENDQQVASPNDENIEMKNDLYAALQKIEEMKKELDEIKSKNLPNSSPNIQKLPDLPPENADFFHLSSQ